MSDTSAVRDFAAGDLVTWLHEPRGGYGYITPVPARVVKVGTSKITIDAELARGGTKRIAVFPAKLRLRRAGSAASEGAPAS